ATATVDTIEATLQHVRTLTSGLARPSVFIHAWDKPIIAIGGGSFLSQFVEIAGARNVYADSKLPSLTVSLEDVILRNPDYVLALAAARRGAADRGNPWCRGRHDHDSTARDHRCPAWNARRRGFDARRSFAPSSAGAARDARRRGSGHVRRVAAGHDAQPARR